MKVCFFADYEQIAEPILYFYKKLKEEYDDSLEMSCLLDNKILGKYVYKKLGEDRENIRLIILSDYLKENWKSFNYERLISFEKKYHCSCMSMLYSDRFLKKRSFEDCVKVMCGYFDLFEDIFGKDGCDFFINEAISDVYTYIAYVVGESYGTSFCAQLVAPGFSGTKHYYTQSPFQYNCNFERDYKDKKYPDEIRRQARELIQGTRERYSKPSYMNFAGKLPSLWGKNLVRPIAYVIKRIMPYWNNPYDCRHYCEYEWTLERMKFYFRWQLSKKYYKQPNFNDKYVLFPLHLQPEATTLVCAAKYERQLFFIDQLAKSLPVDTKLYVKEHYAILGHRELGFYKALLQYPNVVLISPFAPINELILNAEAVVTLTGTMGFEAMIMRKPVIMCGKTHYQNAPGVIHVDDIYMNYLSALKQWGKPSEEEICQYLCEHIQTMYAGCMDPHTPVFKSEINMKNLAESLVCELKRRIAKRDKTQIEPK